MVNNQQTDKIIEKIKQEIIKKTNPISIFLYGSYNTPDYLPGVSDLEFGVIKEDKVSISKILRNIADIYSTTDMRFRLYSYELEKLKNMTFDSPFTKSVFIRHLILTSKTTWGKQIVENLPLPPITLLDAYREATFSTMRALSGIFFLRTNNIEESNEMGYKACLFATLSLEYILGEFPIGFKNIVNTSKKLGLDKESNRLIEFAYKLRQEKIKPSKEELYEFVFNTISYCNQVVEKKIKKELEKGNRILIQ